MQRTAIKILIASTGLTILFVVLWILGFFFVSAAIGNLIHLLLILAMVSSFAGLVGSVLFIVSYFTDRK